MKRTRYPALSIALIAAAAPLLAMAAENTTTRANTDETAQAIAQYGSGQAVLDLHHADYLDDGAWISDIGTLLYADDDADGYFSGLSLSIDADSAYDRYEVYAVIDITNGFDGWSGYGAERLHTTRPFELYGSSATDEYRVDIDLVQNFSPGVYDLRISLIDAHDDRILDQVDANGFRNLRALPLESEDYQYGDTPYIDRPQYPLNDDVVTSEYVGSSGFAILTLLLAGVLTRFRSIKPSAD